MPMRRTSIAGGVVDGAGVGAVRAVGRHDAVHQGLGALIRVLVAVVSCTAHAHLSSHKSTMSHDMPGHLYARNTACSSHVLQPAEHESTCSGTPAGCGPEHLGRQAAC